MILAENVYNMDETGVQLSVPQRSMKMLIDRDQLKQKVSRRAGVQRTQITAIECISARWRGFASADRMARLYAPGELDFVPDSRLALCPVVVGVCG